MFIGIYPLLAAATTLGAAGMLVTGHWSKVWLGGLFAALPFVGLFLKAAILRSMTRTSSSLPVLSAITAAGGAIALWGYLSEDDPSLEVHTIHLRLLWCQRPCLGKDLRREPSACQHFLR